MADNFGLKIGIEGEKEFKKALSDINQSFKVLGSEMKLVSSQFDKNDKSVQALSARNAVLNKEIEAQQRKIDTLRSALQNASVSFGETDRRTQSWQIQLNNAQAALNEMRGELKDNNTELAKAKAEYDQNGNTVKGMSGEMSDAAKNADDLEKRITDAGDASDKSEGKFAKLGSVLKGIGAAMGAVVVAAGAAAVKLGKEVVSAYADYEQLVGGVDTLFKDSSGKLQRYAENAYKTAGLSANDYMETVTGFSASLIASLGGDTDKAVQYADMAITDMSDNANKMGSDMATLQTAYQGFTKQNYTMLDNLKLGYGGTKTEMERLLKDARAISGVEYNIDSYADVVQAIHVIQTSMDITGTTAKEAEHTISGSVNAMRSALQNLIVGFGSADADMELLTSNMVSSFKDVMKNITPVLQNIVSALPAATGALLDAAAELLPTLLRAVTELFSQVLTTVLNLLPSLIPAAVQAVMTIVNALIENLPLLIEAAVQLVTTLTQGLGEALPALVPAAAQAIVTIVQGLIENLPMLLDAALRLITGLAQGILDATPVLIEALPAMITGIVGFLIGAIPQIIDAGIQLLTSLVTALPEIIAAIVAALPQIITGIVTALAGGIPQIAEAGVRLMTSLITNLPSILATIVASIPQIITGIVTALAGGIPQIAEAGVRLMTSLITNLPSILATIVASIPQIITGIVTALGEGVGKVAEVGVNLVKGLWEGIKSLKDWLWNSVSGWISGIWNGIKDFFGIHSPSAEMAWIGQLLVKGLANAIDADGGKAVRAADRMADKINRSMSAISYDAVGFASPAFSDGRSHSPFGYGRETGNVNLSGNNFYIRDESDIRSLALEIAQLTRRKQAGMGLRMA